MRSIDSIYETFKSRPGSAAIASRFALHGLAKWVRRRRPDAVLEIGAGIGTGTMVLISSLSETHGSEKYDLVSIEHNPFCIDQMRENLRGHIDKIRVFAQIDDVPGNQTFDLVMIDGASDDEEGELPDGLSMADENRKFVRFISPRGLIYVEKNREAQRRVIEAALQRKWIHAHYQPWNDGPGFHLYQLDPSMVDRFRFLTWRYGSRLWLGPVHFARQAKRRIFGTKTERRNRKAANRPRSMRRSSR